jgi:hypothetical protein
MLKRKLPPVVKGEGVNHEVGGFSTIVINGIPYPAHVVADAVEALQRENDCTESYPLHAVVFKSIDEENWTLRISGTVNGRSFEVEHYQPLTTTIEDVASLRSLYDAVGFIEQLHRRTEISETNSTNLADTDHSEILNPNQTYAESELDEIAIRDARIAELEKIIENFEDYRGKDWLDLHDQLIISEQKATVFQEDIIRLNSKDSFNWLIGEIHEDAPPRTQS